MYGAIPQELKDLKQWCIYRIVQRDGKKTKIPINANTGEMGKSNDESTWAEFETAVQAVSKFHADGIGFFFKEPYVGVDIDDIRDELEKYFRYGDREGNLVHEFIEGLKSYSEISVSGNGLHIIVSGKLPKGKRKNGDFEMYDKRRFFVMTGKQVGNYREINKEPYNSNLSPLRQLYDKYIGKSEKSCQMSKIQPTDITGNNLTVEEIIDRASNGKNGTRFKVFMNGGWEQFYESQSQADMAFANDLAYWTAKDFNKMDEIFRRSALIRDKWDRKTGSSTYGAITLNNAIISCNNVYNPNANENYLIILDQDTLSKRQVFYSWDDMGNSDRYAAAHKGLLRYSYEAKCWFYYNKKVWKRDINGVSERVVNKVLENMNHEKLYIPADMDEEEAREAFQKHVKRSRNKNAVKAMIELARMKNPVTYSEFDTDNNAVNLNNGWLDLEKNVLNPHDKEKLFTKVADVDFLENAQCPQWGRFLRETFQEDADIISFVQKAVGYTLTTNTSEQVIFVLKGDGNNGKSVFLDVLKAIFNDYAKLITPDALMSQRFNNQNAFVHLAELEGARMAITEETEQGTFFNESLIKQITGNKTMTIKRMYEGVREIPITFKLWLATNYMPLIRGTDYGIWRRLVIVPFDNKVTEDKINKNLIYELLEERSGILNWAIEGYYRWLSEGLKPSEKMLMEVKQHKEDMDWLNKFLEDCCEITEGGTIKASDLYPLYKYWSNFFGEYTYSNTAFGREVIKRFDRKHTRVGKIFYGIRMKNKEDLPFSYFEA